MKNPLPVVFLVCLSSIAPCLAVPETLELVDGRKLEQVTSAVPDDDKMRIVHSGGVMRVPPSDLTVGSRKALGIREPETSVPPAPEIKRLVTLDGKTYEEIRSVKVRPSFISFVHKDGSASVRFDAMPEKLRADF